MADGERKLANGADRIDWERLVLHLQRGDAAVKHSTAMTRVREAPPGALLLRAGNDLGHLQIRLKHS